MNNIEIKAIGVDYRHKQEFEINRPAGSGDFLFIHFTTGIQILTETGKIRGAQGCCVIYAPPFPQWYKGVESGFANDWFHFSGGRVRKLLLGYELPLNRLFYPDRSPFIVDALRKMKQEMLVKMPFRQECFELMVKQFFLELGRALKASSCRNLGRRKAELYEKFRFLKFSLENELASRWTVKKAALKIHLSESRFAVLYREFFGTSFIEDLLHMRLEHAKWLLTNTNISVNEVAGKAGFRNVHYFSRIFRKRYFSPPGKYYKKIIALHKA